MFLSRRPLPEGGGPAASYAGAAGRGRQAADARYRRGRPGRTVGLWPRHKRHQLLERHPV